MRSLRDLNLNSLRVVESAARTGSFVRAAEEQLLTPSAVSQRVKKLEEQLRFKIFNRRNNSVVLTLEGDAFVAHVREALDTILNAGLEAKSLDRDGILKINGLPTFIVRWLLPRLATFKARHPEFRLSISNSYAPANFARQDVDLAIRYGNGDFPGLVSRLLFKEDLTPVCAPSVIQRDVASGSWTGTPVDLAQHTLLHSETCTMNWRFWLEQTGAPDVLEHATSTYFDTCMLSYEAAGAGLGFAIANCSYMMNDIASGKLIAPFRDHLLSGYGWYLVYPKPHGTLDRVQAFEGWIIEQSTLSQEHCDALFSR